jgi:hypothetical protein
MFVSASAVVVRSRGRFTTSTSLSSLAVAINLTKLRTVVGEAVDRG